MRTLYARVWALDREQVDLTAARELLDMLAATAASRYSVGGTDQEAVLDELIRIHKALAHPARVRVLAMLRHGELCVCQINAVIGLAPSTMSAHLRELKDAGFVAERKAGRWVHYSLAAEGAAAAALAALWPALAGDPQAAEDVALLSGITQLTVEAICRPDFDLAGLRRACCTPQPPNSRTQKAPSPMFVQARKSPVRIQSAARKAKA